MAALMEERRRSKGKREKGLRQTPALGVGVGQVFSLHFAI